MERPRGVHALSHRAIELSTGPSALQPHVIPVHGPNITLNSRMNKHKSNSMSRYVSDRGKTGEVKKQ